MTVNHLARILDGKTDDAVINRSIRSTVTSLEKDGMLHRWPFRPENFKGKGKYPNALWLSKEGAKWAREHFPATDPKPHGSVRADLNILHDLKRTDTRIALYNFAASIRAQIGWKKNDLNHTIKPDDYFEITLSKTAHFFLEFERKKKEYKEFLDRKEDEGKFLPYISLRGTREFKDQWGFSNFTVLVPMQSNTGMVNLLIHLRGHCNCLSPKNRVLHKDAPFKLISNHIWLTTYDQITTNPGGKIFSTSADSSLHSLLDIIR